MVGIQCLVSQCAKLHVAWWTFSHAGEVYDFYSVTTEYFVYTVVTSTVILMRAARKATHNNGCDPLSIKPGCLDIPDVHECESRYGQQEKVVVKQQ
jgi:hypothetical protein